MYPLIIFKTIEPVCGSHREHGKIVPGRFGTLLRCKVQMGLTFREGTGEIYIGLHWLTLHIVTKYKNLQQTIHSDGSTIS